MTDHQIVLAGLWLTTAVCWGTKNVKSETCLILTGISLFVSFY